MSKLPYVEIVEQPARNGTRFRYECEGKYKNNIHGVSGDRNSFPTIRVVNHDGPGCVLVSCVTANPPYRPHPHKLSQANKLEDHGACCYYFQPNTLHHITLSNLNVRFCAKKNIDQSLQEREKMRIDPFKTGFEHRMTPRLIDLNCIRLCFQVFLDRTDPARKPIPLPPIVSDPVYNSKAMGKPKICWMSHDSATADGGTVVCILCEKIFKHDVEVTFSREDCSWEAPATIIAPAVFRQVSIVFETPAYANPEQVKEPIEATVKIRRISTGECSEPWNFIILPCAKYEQVVAGKRKRSESKSEMCEQLQMEMMSNSNRLTASEPMVCSTGIIEPWELPHINEFPYLQPQAQYESVTANTKYNIPPEICYKQPDDNAAGALNSNSWVKDLLEIIDNDEFNKFPCESPIAPEPEIRYFEPESQPAPALLLVDVDVMDQSPQQMDCLFDNGNNVQGSGQVASENMRDSVKGFLDYLRDLNVEH